MRISNKIIIIGTLLMCGTSCFSGPPTELLLSDFESDENLNRIHWQCHTLFTLSSENVTHGKKSLRIELYPSDYPGLSFKIAKNNWSRYKTLAFDVYNPGKESSLTVRIDDKLHYPGYEDRFNKTFTLKHGLNYLRIPLNTLITSGTDRIIDLKEICRFTMFMSHPQDKSVLYIDYVRLI